MGINFSPVVEKFIRQHLGDLLTTTKEYLTLMEGFSCDNLPDYEKEFYSRVEKTYPIGSVCKVRFTSYTGIIDSYNTVPIQSLYSGLRYPVRIRITGISDITSKYKDSIGKIFSYGLNQIQLIEIETEKEHE